MLLLPFKIWCCFRGTEVPLYFFEYPQSAFYIYKMKNNQYILTLFGCLLSYSILAQNPFPKLAPVFKDDIVPQVYIQIDQDSLNAIFANIFSDHLYPATFIFDNREIRDTVENVGMLIKLRLLVTELML